MKDNQISLIQPPDFSFEECLWFLNRNFDDCLVSFRGKSILKAIVIRGRQFLIRVVEAGECIVAEILSGEADKESRDLITAYLAEWFDLHRDIQPFYDLLSGDDAVAYMRKDFYGLRLVSIPDLFEAVCWGIIGQQINLTFAYKLKRRLVEKYGAFISYEGEHFYIFPEPRVLAAINPEELKSLQFSGSKVRYLVNVARAFADGSVSKEKISLSPSLAEKQKVLTDLTGVGTWTANYVLMKSLREPASIPHGDVGLLQALQNHKVIVERNEADRIAGFFQRYAHWENYLVFYLWRSLALKKNE